MLDASILLEVTHVIACLDITVMAVPANVSTSANTNQLKLPQSSPFLFVWLQFCGFVFKHTHTHTGVEWIKVCTNVCVMMLSLFEQPCAMNTVKTEELASDQTHVPVQEDSRTNTVRRMRQVSHIHYYFRNVADIHYSLCHINLLSFLLSFLSSFLSFMSGFSGHDDHHRRHPLPHCSVLCPLSCLWWLGRGNI